MPVMAGEERIPLGAELICPLHPMYDGLPTTEEPRPPLRVVGRPVWLVTRYQDVRAVLAHSRVAKDVGAATDLYNQHTGGDRPVIGGAIATHLLKVDPPDHARLRKLMAGAFSDNRHPGLRRR